MFEEVDDNAESNPAIEDASYKLTRMMYQKSIDAATWDSYAHSKGTPKTKLNISREVNFEVHVYDGTISCSICGKKKNVLCSSSSSAGFCMDCINKLHELGPKLILESMKK